MGSFKSSLFLPKIVRWTIVKNGGENPEPLLQILLHGLAHAEGRLDATPDPVFDPPRQDDYGMTRAETQSRDDVVVVMPIQN